MPRGDEEHFDDPYAEEKHNRSTHENERDAQRHGVGYSKGGQSESRRERTAEHRGGGSPRRETGYQSAHKGRERAASPLNYIKGYMDDPPKHRRGSPEDGSLRREIAFKQVDGGWYAKEDVSGDNQTARRDRDRAGIETRDFAQGDRRSRVDVERAASDRKHGKPREKGKERRG